MSKSLDANDQLMAGNACLTMAKLSQHDGENRTAVLYAKVALKLYAMIPGDHIVVESNTLAADRIIRDCNNAIGPATPVPAGADMTKKPIKPAVGHPLPGKWPDPPPPPKGPQKRAPDAMTQSIDPRSPEGQAFIEGMDEAMDEAMDKKTGD